ncbi:flagellar hook-length control protein FliK [Deltaproteobacteria bacterium]|nr:flagellar hook-length control protein FliK [Deltaproteobacteria bacterium]
MEAIGQKTVIPVNDEAIAVTEFGIESEDVGENKVFDATLKQELAEIPLDEELLEGLLDEDALSSSLNSVLLTQNQQNPKNAENEFYIAQKSNIPLEILEDTHLNKNVSSLQVQVLKKTTPISTEMLEVIDPRTAVNGSNVDVLPEKGIAETGLQYLLHESTNEAPREPLLHKVFHQAKSLENGAEISVEGKHELSHLIPLDVDHLESANKLLTPLDSVQLEADAESSTNNLKASLRTSIEPELAEGELDISKSELPVELESNSNQDFQTKNMLLQNQSSILENQEESPQDNLQTIFHRGIQEGSLEPERLVAENLLKIKRDNLHLAPEKIKAAESSQLVDNLNINIALQAKEDLLVAEKQLVSEPLVKEKTLVTEPLVKEKTLVTETVVKEKTLVTEPMVKEKTLVTEPLVKEKTLVTEPMVKEKNLVTETVVKEKTLVTEPMVKEKIQIGATERSYKEIRPSEMHNVSEEFKSLTKTKLEAGFQATEKFQPVEKIQQGVNTKALKNFTVAEMESRLDVSGKGSDPPLTQFRTLTLKDTQLSDSTKSSVDSPSPSGINSLAEVSGTSMVKGGNSTNTSAELLRGTELPFNMEQVVSRVRILRGNGIEEMTLRLHPEDLGQITLKIRQTGADLSIDMRVDNIQAKLIVESGFDSLRSRFLDQEFSYQDLALNVDINEGDSQYEDDQNNYVFEEEKNSAESGKKDEIATVEETPRISNNNETGLNLYV